MSLRLRRVLLALALAAGAALAAAPSASAAAYQYYGAETANPTAGATAFTQFNAAHSVNLISIESNYVHCPASGPAHVTWCGTVGNNTNHAQAGVNYTVNGVSYWMREDVYAAVVYGSLRCTTRGNAPSHFLTACAGVAQ